MAERPQNQFAFWFLLEPAPPVYALALRGVRGKLYLLRRHARNLMRSDEKAPHKIGRIPDTSKYEI